MEKYNKSYIKRPKWTFGYSKIFYPWYYFEITKSYSLRNPTWKDKYETPRVEVSPYISIICFGIEFRWDHGYDQYWEKWLWIHYYNNHDEKKAIKTWPWRTIGEKKYKERTTWGA